MRALKSLLEKKKIKNSPDIDEKTIFYLWQKIVEREYGKQGTNQIKFGLYKNQTLFLNINNSNWRNEIWMMKDFLRQQLNREIGQEEIKKIVIKND